MWEKGCLAEGQPGTLQKNGPFLSRFSAHIPLCSCMLFLTENAFAQWGHGKLSSPSGASGPCTTLKCCFMPCWDAKDQSQSGQGTLLPYTQAGTCALNILLLAKTFPHFSQGNFSPLCTPIWHISLW